MAYLQSTHTPVPSLNWVSGFLHAVAERFERRAVYSTTLNELSQLSDRDLADLGMSRSSIRSVAYEAAYKS